MSVSSYSLERSRQLLERSEEIMVRGCQGHKRSGEMLKLGYPVFAQRAQGARFWDVDGNCYLDYLLGFGPILLGYDDPVVNAAIQRQMQEGTIYSVAHPKELEVAEKLIELIPCAEMVAFFIGGSAATSGAVRLARAYTGREYVIRCGYHGWHSWAQPEGAGVPKAVGELTLAVPYNDLEALEDSLRKREGEVACVMLEAMQGEGPREGYLQGVIELCHRHGALAVFDEIKVGFRMAWGGAHEYYGVVPDLATFGKACCNGYAGSFVVGRREVLSHPNCQAAWLAATFHCDLPSLVALEAVIGEMQRRDGIAYQWRIGERLMAGINGACAEAGLSFRLVGAAPMPVPRTGAEDREQVLAMLRGCLARGHYLPPSHPWFLSLAHSEQDIESTVQAVRESSVEVRA